MKCSVTRKKLIVKISNGPQKSNPDWIVVRAEAGPEGYKVSAPLITMEKKQSGGRCLASAMPAGAQHQLR